MDCPDCEIPMYEFFIKHEGVRELSKCPLCGYRDD
jgi:hypothetical protein